MMRRLPAESGDGDDDRGDEVDRRRTLARAAGVVVLFVAAVSFVVENAQPVKVRFWFFTGHPRLIYVVVACLVVGAVLGLALMRQVRRRRAERRANRRGLFRRHAA